MWWFVGVTSDLYGCPHLTNASDTCETTPTLRNMSSRACNPHASACNSVHSSRTPICVQVRRGKPMERLLLPSSRHELLDEVYLLLLLGARHAHRHLLLS
jgi:hypothetical protein